MRKLGTALFLLLWMVTGLSGCSGADMQKEGGGQAASVSASTPSEAGWEIIQSSAGNLYGDQTAERIQLAVREQDSQSPTRRWQIRINEKKAAELDNRQGFYDVAKFSLEDMDHDGYKELLLFRINGGSGGGEGLRIYKAQNNHLITLLDTDPGFEDQEDFTVHYNGHYQVGFTYKKAGFNTIIPLNPEHYQGMESELSKIDNWVDPIAEYEIKDLDQDGVKEVIGIRRVIGISHPDTIACLKVVYRSKDGQYGEPVSYLLTDAQDQVIAEKTM